MTTNLNDVKDAAATSLNTAKKTAITTASAAKDKVAAVGADMSERVSDTAARMRDGAIDQMDATREALSDSGAKLSATLRDAADAPETGTLQARMMSVAADGLESVATDLRNTSVAQVSSDVQSYAHRNPMAFAAGAAVAGFLVARLFRPSAQS